MSVKDIESLLQPIPGADPCGTDFEYDPGFLDLERRIQGKPEQQMGSSVVPAQGPDWDAVAKAAAALLGKTKDLRIALHLTRALLSTDGFAGLRDGLAVLRGLVERYWDGVYPRLDPDEENDPTIRLNVLVGLCDSAVTDRLRMVHLVTARSFGRFSLRDLAVASGELPPTPGVEPPTNSAIDGAFAEVALEELQATEASVRASREHLAAIGTAVGAHVGDVRGPDFSKLAGLLGQAHKVLVARLDRRGVASAAPVGDSPSDAAAANPAALSAPLTGAVTSREDVVRILERICDYYQRHEPSSPLPLLLQRCKRLVSASFLDIIRDVAPEAVAQVESLRGKES